MARAAILAYISVCLDVPQLLRAESHDHQPTGQKDLGGSHNYRQCQPCEKIYQRVFVTIAQDHASLTKHWRHNPRSDRGSLSLVDLL
jgi:hypothetical protein